MSRLEYCAIGVLGGLFSGAVAGTVLSFGISADDRHYRPAALFTLTVLGTLAGGLAGFSRWRDRF
jgi:hypothetical protein